MPGRCRQLVSRLFLCVAFFFDAVKYIRQGVRRRCVCRTDETCVYIRGCACLGVAQTARYGGNGNMSCYKQAGVGVPLRYNYDKPEKPRRIKGFEVFSLVFSSFSKPKNHTEISRIIGGVSLTTNE